MKQRIRRIEKALSDSGLGIHDMKGKLEKIAFDRAMGEFFDAFGLLGPSEFVEMLKKDGMNRSDVSLGELAEYLRAKIRAKAEGLQSEPQ